MHNAGESAADMAARLRGRAHDKRAEADRLDQQAAHYERGSDGERQVGAVLEDLRGHGWVTLHDVRWPGRPKANIDHVAIGPGGIAVVDAKNWSGTVTVRDGVVRRSGYRRNREVDGVYEAAQAVGRVLTLPWSLHVIPVLCTVGHPDLGVQRAESVTVVDSTSLRACLTSLPAQLTATDVGGLAEFLRTALSRSSAFSSERAVAGPGAYGHHPLASQRRHADRGRADTTALRRASRREAARRRELRKLVAAAAVLAFLLFGGWPLYLKLAQGAGSVAAGAIMRSLPTVTPTAAAPTLVPTFSSCTQLNARLPHGVAKPNAVNKGARVTGPAAVDAAGYARNARLDTDHDGIACER